MATVKTEISELSVAFGILELKPDPCITEKEIISWFRSSLPYSKYKKYCQEIRKDATLRQLAHELFILGKNLREKCTSFNQVSSVLWIGGKRQGSTVTSSQDLSVNTVPVSVKVDSNVMYNKSPANLLQNLPQGISPESNTDNWYIKVAKDEFQNLYNCAARIANLSLPADVQDFEENASRNTRKALQKAIAEAEPSSRAEFDKLYTQMCLKVSESSANVFNKLLTQNMKTRRKNSIIETILKTFFRINSVPYLLAVKEGNLLLGCSIPNVTEWRNNWEFEGLTAYADKSSMQSKVIFKLQVRPKNNQEKKVITFPFHAEIRWSHGKFCGAPEAKLYKDFRYEDIPFFDTIIKLDVTSDEFKQIAAKIDF